MLFKDQIVVSTMVVTLLFLVSACPSVFSSVTFPASLPWACYSFPEHLPVFLQGVWRSERPSYLLCTWKLVDHCICFANFYYQLSITISPPVVISFCPVDLLPVSSSIHSVQFNLLLFGSNFCKIMAKGSFKTPVQQSKENVIINIMCQSAVECV